MLLSFFITITREIGKSISWNDLEIGRQVQYFNSKLKDLGFLF
jgi:hypothetical protein